MVSPPPGVSSARSWPSIASINPLATASPRPIPASAEASSSRAAALSSAEAATLSELARTSLAGDQSSEEFLDQLREQFQLDAISVFEGADDGPWRLRASVGQDAPQVPEDADIIDRPRPGLVVGLKQRAPAGGDRQLLSAYEAHLAALLEREKLILHLRDSIKLIEGNRVKTSILRLTGKGAQASARSASESCSSY